MYISWGLALKCDLFKGMMDAGLLEGNAETRFWMTEGTGVDDTLDLSVLEVSSAELELLGGWFELVQNCSDETIREEATHNYIRLLSPHSLQEIIKGSDKLGLHEFYKWGIEFCAMNIRLLDKDLTPYMRCLIDNYFTEGFVARATLPAYRFT
jgi:hypothetical protein